jgi:ubiquinone/menaquinone biosynthesis C-methylase UbiE
MSLAAYQIRDCCRRNLVKYTLKAFTHIPRIKDSLILDIGCGTGETVMALLKTYQCKVVAVDEDKECLSILKEKIKATTFVDRIKIIHGSIYDKDLLSDQFDVILAEGLLNIIGFENGLPLILKNLKQTGYLIIHDELEKDAHKRELFEKYALKITGTLELDENIWWKEYYGCLERLISGRDDSTYINEINEINQYKMNPSKCKSILYILKHQS